jgi:P-type Cu+ transporter
MGEIFCVAPQEVIVAKNIRKTIIGIAGMHCASCAHNIEKQLAALPGVADARVNFAAGAATVSFDPDAVTIEKIFQAVTDAGYKPVGSGVPGSFGTQDAQRQRERDSLKARFLLSLCLSVFLMYISMAGTFALPLYTPFLEHSPLIQLILATVVIVCGLSFFSSGVIAFIKTRRANMDTLICLGVGSAYFYSLYLSLAARAAGVTHHPVHLYYETAAFIVTFILFGKYLESTAKGKTSRALYKLMSLAPKKAYVMRDGREAEIPVDDIMIGDIVAVKPGGRIPADGIVIEGYSSVDEAMVTGEALPVEKSPGRQVIAGTVNKTGSFRFEAIKVGRETFLAQIIALVQEAQGSRAPIQQLADTVAGFFVPAVLIIAVCAYLIWIITGHDSGFALRIFISVLIIACPCSLGLATPTAVMVATGIAAQRGILIKQASSLQRASGIDTVVFDKTGTLTKGVPRVTDVIGYTRPSGEIVCIAASVEKKSEHPLAGAIGQDALDRGCGVKPVADFVSHPGKGVSATVDGEYITLGNRKALELKNIQLPPRILEDAQRLEAEGKTVMFVAGNARIFGLLAVGDTLKDFSIEAVALLRRMGKRVVMITGDNPRTAQSLAQVLGVDAVLAEVLPQDKEAEVKKMQARGEKVAMVGDGINDAPALAQADVGIAIGSGTDIAIESADIILVRSDPRDAVTVLDLSRYAMKKIRQNLFWAFFYNLIGIPVAAGVLYPATGFLLNPVIAAAAMAFSSVSVVVNALSMGRYRLPELKPRI